MASVSGPGRTLFVLVACLAAGLLAYNVVFHYRLVVQPGAQEHREGAALLTTDLLMKGGDPYHLEYLPLHTNGYGVLYNATVIPFVKRFGLNYRVHRAVTAGFIVAAAALVSLFLRGAGAGLGLSALGGIIAYLFFVGSYTTLARPDAMGLCLFLLSLYLAQRSGYSVAGLAASIALGLLALMTKPYFVFAIPCLAAYLFLFRSKLQGLAYAAAAALGLAALIPLVDAVWPYYWFSTFTAHRQIENSSYAWMLHQLGEFSLLHAGLLGILGARLIGFWRARRPSWNVLVAGLDFSDIRAPLWRRGGDLNTCLIAASAAALILVVGRNPGAYMVYFTHLLTPFVVVGALGAVARAGRLKVASGCGLLLNLFVLVYYLPVMPDPRAQEFRRAWERIYESGKTILAPPQFIDLALRHDQPIFDNGQTEFLIEVVGAGRPGAESPLQARVRAHLDAFKQKVESGYFDVILLQDDNAMNHLYRDYLKENYRRRGVWYLASYYANYHPLKALGKGTIFTEIWIRPDDPDFHRTAGADP